MQRLTTIIIVLCHIMGTLTFASEPDDAPTIYMMPSFEQESVSVGDTVTLNLNFNKPDNVRLPDKITLKGAEDLILSDIQQTVDGIQLKILVDGINLFDVPVLSFTGFNEAGELIKFESKPVSIKVIPAIDDEPDKAIVRPIKNIVTVSHFWDGKIIYIILILIALVIFILWFFRRKIKKFQEETVPEIPPDKIAFDALRQLREDFTEFSDDQVKAYYFTLSLIQREYMGHIREFPAAELTTEEIALAVKLEDDRAMLRLLRQIDMIKFAEQRPTTSEREEHWKQVWKYVKDTSDKIKKSDINNES